VDHAAVLLLVVVLHVAGERRLRPGDEHVAGDAVQPLVQTLPHAGVPSLGVGCFLGVWDIGILGGPRGSRRALFLGPGGPRGSGGPGGAGGPARGLEEGEGGEGGSLA